MVKKSAFLEEFKKFISRGNVIDLAVGVIVGNAFSAIVKSLVNDIVMPFIGLISGGVNFTSLEVVLRKPIEGREPLVLAYGSFIQAVIDFLLIALVVFVVIKGINTFREKREKPLPTEPAPAPQDIVLLTEIRDLLKRES